MVIAALSHEHDAQIQVTLVESDVRKSVFLKTVARELDLRVHVENQRIENLDSLSADVVSARALADLSALLCLSNRHLSKDGMMIFLKGKNWSSEVEKAQSEWNFEHQIVKSKTSEGSIILCVSGAHRV
ncbi:RsmG family class I SAM-dependent methyltransferase [Roseovarius sp. S88]|uniref:RsmG family class I SAM-dependent methyltransferase n=1 Tax=Roseovarius phycicola TaxID=3080976 RepID=A0ABZ2HIW3_9RHOB